MRFDAVIDAAVARRETRHAWPAHCESTRAGKRTESAGRFRRLRIAHDLRDAFDELDVDARQCFALAVGHLDHQAIRDVLRGP